MQVGLISDTHGLLRPEAVQRLTGSDLILHAGDVGRPEVLEELSRVAEIRAVRGNVDEPDYLQRRRPRNLDPAWAESLPLELALELAGNRVRLVHDIATLTVPVDTLDVLVVGHSHQPRITREGEVLIVNPGSAGPRRFRLPVTVGLLWLDRDTPPRAEILEL